MKARALKFVRYSQIEDFLRLGWVVMIPNAPMHHHAYGIEMRWVCDCKILVVK